MMEPGGWADTYEKEWETLTNCVAMAAEEERIKQIDDQEADMDLACAKESSCMEALRRMEIRRGLGLAARDRVKAIRRERMRWAVRDVRRNVIKRSRKDLQEFAEVARSKRPLDVEQTISYEKRRDRERDEEADVRQMEREARKKRFAELKQKGEGNLEAREAYDAVISGVRDILATATFDARRSKKDFRGRGLNEVAPAASAAATAAAEAARKAVADATGSLGGDGDDGDTSHEKSATDTSYEESAAAAAAAAAAATTAAAAVMEAGAELGGGNVCRACGGPRFGRTVCAKCGANAKNWEAGVESDGD
eukprot:jgi/Undpi1/2947/HiC_scaffold_14.g06324.m1